MESIKVHKVHAVRDRAIRPPLELFFDDHRATTNCNQREIFIHRIYIIEHVVRIDLDAIHTDDLRTVDKPLRGFQTGFTNFTS
ncbi:MAG TPA: hypothetical protein DD465_23095 [Thalassospira sp.]|nr:hypothetical protein [Thalassospira sp.]